MSSGWPRDSSSRWSFYSRCLDREGRRRCRTVNGQELAEKIRSGLGDEAPGPAGAEARAGLSHRRAATMCPAAARWVHEQLGARFLVTVGADTRKMDAPLGGKLRARDGPGVRRLPRLLARRGSHLPDGAGDPRPGASADPDDHRRDPRCEVGGERDPGPARVSRSKGTRTLGGWSCPTTGRQGSFRCARRSRTTCGPTPIRACGPR